MDQQEKRHEDVVTNFERQVRELRSQVSMKNKDIANYREETADLESRLSTKTNELRTVKTQMQVVQSRYEEAMQEIDQLQAGKGRRPDRA